MFFNGVSMDKKMKVAWICNVSNQEIRSHLDLKLPLWRKFLKYFKLGNVEENIPDNSHWNTNAIVEFEKINTVDLHVVFVHPNMNRAKQHFTINGINFYGVTLGDTSFWSTVKSHLHLGEDYCRTWKIITSIIKDINPDIVHVMGAENPSYSMSTLYLPKEIPILVQMQTILNDPGAGIPDTNSQKKCEFDVINRANYIGTEIKQFANLIRANIKKDAVIVSTRLMVAEKANHLQEDKLFDYVYFANRISKSIDLAVEAFAIALKQHPEITLHIIGGATEPELAALNTRLDELECKSSVVIEGELPTHDDVMEHIRKARFALLPLKIDVVSGTIREAMWNGLPVVTTITSGTPSLNDKRESVLLSETGDHSALAANICRLVENYDLAERLRKNASATVEEMFGDNGTKAKEWMAAYEACINHYQRGSRIPEIMLNKG